MAVNYRIPVNLEYLSKNRPRRINWVVVAPKGAILSPIQQYDLIYDDIDVKIRKLDGQIFR